MFDFLTKLFSSADKNAQVASSNEQISASPHKQQAQTVDKKLLEQTRQAWRQKVDAAAQNEAVLLDLMFACDDAEGRFYASQYLQSVSALEQAKAHFKKSDQRIVKSVQTKLDEIKRKEQIAQAGADCIAQAQTLLDAGVVLPNQLAQLDQANKKLEHLGELPQEIAHTFAQKRQQLEHMMQEQVQLQRQVLDAIVQLKVQAQGEAEIVLEQWNALKAKLAAMNQTSAAASLPRNVVREAEQLIQQGEVKLAEQLKRRREGKQAAGLETIVESTNEAMQQESKAEAKAVSQEGVNPTQSSGDINAEPHAEVTPKTMLDQKSMLAALEGLEASLREGRSQQARQFEKILQELDLNAKDVPAYLNKQLRQRLMVARKEFAHLMSWARWSGVASREELVATAEGLAQLRLSPKEIVDTVTALRGQWKQIEEVGGAGSKELWTRFDAACSAAYAPAAAHFQEQAQVRKANSDKAREMLSLVTGKLEALMSATPDWRAVSNSLAQIRQEWRQLGVLERKEKQTLERELDVILAPVESALQAERELVQQERIQLIAEVQKLDASQRDAADRIRQLQQTWQQSASRIPLERKREQDLWNAFRSACDQVFAARKEQHQAAEQERLQHLQEKQALCDNIEQVLRAEHDRGSLKDQLKRFEQQWQCIGPVPRQDEKAIGQRYHQALAAIEQRLVQLEEQQRQTQLKQLQDQLRICFAVELGEKAQVLDEATALTGKDVSSKHLQQRVSTLIAAVERGAATEEFTEQQTTIRQAVLQLEILWELPSPTEEQAQRRQMQLQMLQQSLKQGRDTHVEQKLFAQVIVTPCAPDQALQTRLLKVLDAGLVRWPLK